MSARFIHYLFYPRAEAGYGDLMATDPVCNMTVYPDLAASCEDYQGKHYCFCTSTCRETFDKNRDLYANRAYRMLDE
jgi:YHS domain-containing protein